MSLNPTASDDKLLKRESSIRRERTAAFVLTIGCLMVFVASSARLISAEAHWGQLAMALFIFAYGDSCTTRLRHIKSIKYYRSQLSRPEGRKPSLE